MTHVFNAPADFKEEFVSGLAAAYGRYVERVPGASAVMRRGGPRPGRVSLIIGGGSGHYPAFAGVVGDGLATAAVIGDIFTSPSAEQAYRTVRAVDSGAGVLFSYGNYGGDVMHFGLAELRARSEGADVRTVLVTDDIASAPPERAADRRGIAGDFLVFKAAGAAAERGDSLDEAERVAGKANDRTRTLGVAFAGCTFPGRDEPLFTVDPARMEIGLGIHGEPGVRTVDRLTASELAYALVGPLLAERPAGAGDEVALILNGLGGTKYEELFVLYADVARLLAAEGLRVRGPEVGELVTSLDMAGCSLTLGWLDEELAELWDAPADTPAFRRTAAASTVAAPPAPAPVPDGDARPGAGAAPASTRLVRDVLDRMRDRVTAGETELAGLDAVAGDGDHGAGMCRGLKAAADAAARGGEEAGPVLVAAGAAFADRAGGASGALWGVLLDRLGTALTGGTGSGAVAAGLRSGAVEMMRLGRSAPGDKTLLDALVPFLDVLEERLAAGDGLPAAWTAALPAAADGAAATAALVTRRGRAAALGERGRGTPDPGAVSLTWCLEEAADVLAETLNGGRT
ncbi:dihydroxyacetone kinase family protein [Actinomadura vinacea]|uniref:Dihydroxyacetone kinase family protein n=1 Tax=Actinomadura vinacea TaxID=115336 RepID=A0ABN3KGI0_9ACTN